MYSVFSPLNAHLPVTIASLVHFLTFLSFIRWMFQIVMSTYVREGKVTTKNPLKKSIEYMVKSSESGVGMIHEKMIRGSYFGVFLIRDLDQVKMTHKFADLNL